MTCPHSISILNQAYVCRMLVAISINHFAPQQNEKISLHITVAAIALQSPQKGDKGVLHDILGVCALTEPGPGEA